MVEYLYKGFKVSYNIKPIKNQTKLYEAEGYVARLADPEPVQRKRFHTESTSMQGVTAEIKKLLENYIDFEWREFHEIHDQKL